MSEILEENFLKKGSNQSIGSPIVVGQTDNTRMQLLEIEPRRCMPWGYHNRDTAWLTKEHCQDLIFSIQKNGQLEPGLVRKISNNPDIDFEIICGARRWFACSQTPLQKFLAFVTDADDKKCMLFMHAENAASKDITEFERSFSFAQQMKSGLFKNQIEMAESFGVTQGTISKMINAAEIFEYPWVRRLFQNKLDITVKYAYALSTLLKKVDSLNFIEKEASIIQNEQEKKGGFLPASIVLKRLINSAKPFHTVPLDLIMLKVNDKTVVSCHQNRAGKFSIIIEKEVKTLDRSLVEKTCIQTIREEVLDKLFPRE